MKPLYQNYILSRPRSPSLLIPNPYYASSADSPSRPLCLSYTCPFDLSGELIVPPQSLICFTEKGGLEASTIGTLSIRRYPGDTITFLPLRRACSRGLSIDPIELCDLLSSGEVIERHAPLSLS